VDKHVRVTLTRLQRDSTTSSSAPSPRSSSRDRTFGLRRREAGHRDLGAQSVVIDDRGFKKPAYYVVEKVFHSINPFSVGSAP